MAIRTNSDCMVRNNVNDAPPFSDMLWVKYWSFTFTGTPDTAGVCLFRSDESGGGQYGARVTTAGVVIGFAGASTITGPTIGTGEWHHIAMTRVTGTGAGNYELFVDGVSYGTVSVVATNGTGAYYGAGWDVWDGGYRCDISIRCGRAFDSQLSLAEVVAEAESTTVVKAGSYYSAAWDTISDFGGFTEGNFGQATNDTNNPDFDLGGGGLSIPIAMHHYRALRA